jgi:hypothetical protein
MRRSRSALSPETDFSEYNPKFFVTDLRPGSEEARYANERYHESSRALIALMESLTQRSRFSLPDEYRFPAIQRPHAVQLTVQFAYAQGAALVRSLEYKTTAYFSAAARLVSSMLDLMRQKREDGIAVHCSVRQVEDYFLSGYERKLSVAKTLAHIVSLKKFTIRYQDSPRFPEIPIESMQAAMRDCAGDALEAVDFSPYSRFDGFFAFFIAGSRELGAQFDTAVDQIGGRLDVTPLSGLIKATVQVFKPKLAAELLVLKHAIYRIFFDQLYLKKGRLLDGDPGDRRRLAKQCERVRWLTPRQMSIPEKMMKPEMMDVSFARLAQRAPQLHEAGELLASLHFLTNPIDMMATIFFALKAGEEFVRQNHFENRFGRWVSMFDREKVAGVSDQLAFDDFFPLFCLIFSLSPPITAVGIASFLTQLGGIALSSAFDFAKLFFTSAVQYLLKLNLADLTAGVDDDEDDPLGLSHLRSPKKATRTSLFS